MNISELISWIFSQATGLYTAIIGNWILAAALGFFILSAIVVLIFSMIGSISRRRRF